MQRQGRGLGAVWACASKHWHNIQGGGGGGGGVKYAFNLMQRLWPSDRLLSATEFNFSLKKIKKMKALG